jgi:hypothetical protein
MAVSHLFASDDFGFNKAILTSKIQAQTPLYDGSF